MKQAKHFQISKAWQLIIMDLGFNPGDVLRLAGLPEDLFSRSGATLSADDYFKLWHGLEISADQAFGLVNLPVRIGQAISPEIFDPPLFSSLCSPNLIVALQRLSQYKRLIGPMILDVDSSDNGLFAKMTCYQANDSLPYSLAATEVVFFTKVARIATRKAIKPMKVSLPNLISSNEALNEYLGLEVQKGEQLEIAFSKQDALQPFLTEDAGMWQFFEPALKQRLYELDLDAKIAERVKSSLLEMLPSGYSSMDEVASRLAMSKRTLQRKLKDEGCNFKDILQNVREDLANHYLSSSELSHGEISYLLGFNDTNSFIRAYSSWTGQPPGQFRSSLH